MDFGLKDKNAVVTGGSRGIGRAIAEGLLREGARVMIVSKNADKLESAARSLRDATGGTVVTASADLSDPADIDAYCAKAEAEFGTVDILVNNAGATPAGDLFHTDDAVWQAAVDLKLMGYVRSARALLPAMKERGWGRIVNVIGLGAHQASPTYVAGGAINASLLNVTRALAKDAAPSGVTVNAVNPAAIATERWEQLILQRTKLSGLTVEEERRKSVGNTPMGRAGRPEEVAAMVVFLCSEQASYVSGALIDIDAAAGNGL